MSLPDPPSTFRPPTPAERPWWWRLENAAGDEVDVSDTDAAEHAGQRFPNQADAESWIGETWEDLLDAGVTAVRLFEGDREVYGPMALSA